MDHITQAQGGQFKGALKTTAPGEGEEVAGQGGQKAGFDGFVVRKELGCLAIAAIAPDDFRQGSRTAEARAHEHQVDPGSLGGIQEGPDDRKAAIEP
ncbi:MAG: hypothetical protein Fur0042_21200 [Cyanophyceae cyanobacterium]